MADSGVLHLNQHFISLDLVQYDRGELEVIAGLGDLSKSSAPATSL